MAIEQIFVHSACKGHYVKALYYLYWFQIVFLAEF